MLSALYGVWAARAANRQLSLDLLEQGYGRFCTGRFLQTLEYRKDVFPEQPPAGPFLCQFRGPSHGIDLGFSEDFNPTAGEPKSLVQRAHSSSGRLACN